MPISVDERDALRNLVTFTRDEVAAAGDPENNLASLQALNEQRLQEYRDTVEAERAALWVLIEADPTGTIHQQWSDAQNGVWTRLIAAMPANELLLMFTNPDPRIKGLSKSLIVFASLRWTVTNHGG